jgi:iron(III) transport system substrate-binding protein
MNLEKLFYIILVFFMVACSPEKKEEEKVVNVYSHRHYEADKIIFDEFTRQTGIKVNVVKAGADELIMRIKSEGKKSPADVLITVDSGRLERAKQEGLLQPINNQIIQDKINPIYRDKDNYWFGISSRARLIVYSPEQLGDIEPPLTYEDLAHERFKGKLLVRSSENIYNQSLLASLILNLGEDEAEKWAKGVVSNLAAPPKGGDRDQIKYIASGIGAVSIVNDYYVAQMLNSDNDTEREAASQVELVFPNQADRGTHVNISGVGVVKYSKNRNEAEQLIDFLVSEFSQRILVEQNYESSVNPESKTKSLILSQYPELKIDQLNVGDFGAKNRDAVMTFDKVGWK